MLSAPLSGLWSFWRGLTRLDRAALGVTLLYGLVWLGRAFKREIPFSRFIGFLFFLSLSYLLFRILGLTLGRFLCSTANLPPAQPVQLISKYLPQRKNERTMT